MTISSPLKNQKDRRTLLWSLVFFPLLPVIGITHPQWVLLLSPLALYLGFCAGVLSHYHNHRGVFRQPLLNQVYSTWLSIFYGFPIFSWIPTHNQNHHKFINGPGDTTSTLRRGEKDNLYEALTYPTRSSIWQGPALVFYWKKLNKKGFWGLRWAIAQALALVTFHIIALTWSLVQNGLKEGLLAYSLLVLLPALWAPWSMMFINYVQHVGCDYTCPNNHSRNFVGSWENWFVFDAGLHTVHHENPGVHWSHYQELHDKRQERIHPRLCQRNVFSFLWLHYLLGKRIKITKPLSNATSSIAQ